MIGTDLLPPAGSKFSVGFGHLDTLAKSKLTAEKISVRSLSFFYEDGKQALKDISIPIYSERVTALIGPSGCGKSTLLRIFDAKARSGTVAGPHWYGLSAADAVSDVHI